MKPFKNSSLVQKVVPIDKDLERFRGRVLFPKKLALAEEILAKSDLPKIFANGSLLDSKDL